jgi:hypothetical protein
MRYLAFVMTLLLGASEATAQQNTLFKDSVDSGGFGGPVVKVTSINDQATLMVGGRGGWIIGHSLVIGGGGYGVTTEVNATEGAIADQGPLNLQFGYGGLELEYRIHPQSLGHIGFYTLIGGGSTTYVKDAGSLAASVERVGATDSVFVVEPGVNAELNVTRWLHLNAGMTYRVVTGVTQAALRNGDLSGFTGALTFKFGSF